MEISSQLLDSANAVIKAKIDQESIDKKIKELATKWSKQVKIDGFRKGKVPLNVVLNRYKKELDRDAKQELFKEIVDSGLEKIGKKADEILGDPIFSKFEEKEGLDLEMEVAFRPKVDITGYEEAIPTYQTPRVTKKEIEAKVDEFLKMIAPIKPSEKEVLEKGDFAKFDFEGFVDGVAFEGGAAKDYLLEIGSGQFIPGFEDGMIGMKVKESKEIKVTFPKEYQAKNLAGKDAVFKVVLNGIEVKDVQKTITDETLKKYFPNDKEISVEKFEERIKEQLRDGKMKKLIEDELKPAFAKSIVEKIEFDLPKNIVEQEIDMRFRGKWTEFSKEQLDKFKEDKEAINQEREKLRPEAVESVKLTFIVDELAKEKKIEVSDNELVQAVYLEAYNYGADPKEHFKRYQEQGVLPALKMAMVEDKLFDDLFVKNKKKDKEDEQ